MWSYSVFTDHVRRLARQKIAGSIGNDEFTCGNRLGQRQNMEDVDAQQQAIALCECETDEHQAWPVL